MAKYTSRVDFVIASIFRANAKSRILDVGFIGEYAEPFIHNAILNNFSAQSEIVGIDTSEKIGNYISDGSIIYRKKSVYDLGGDALYKDIFDIVVMCEVIEHLNNPWLAFENCSRSLKLGGRYIITFPNPYAIQKLISYLLVSDVTAGSFINKFLGARDHLHFPLLPGMLRHGNNLGLVPIEVAFMKGPGISLPRLNRLSAYVGVVFEKRNALG